MTALYHAVIQNTHTGLQDRFRGYLTRHLLQSSQRPTFQAISQARNMVSSTSLKQNGGQRDLRV